MPATPRVLVVGAGLTGAIAARRMLRHGGVQVELWEALHTVGGRMRNDVYAADEHVLTDSGAQYITMAEGVEAIPAHQEVYSELIGAGLLVPMTGRIDGTRAADGSGTNFVCKDGLTAVVQWLLESTSPTRPRVTLGRVVHQLDLTQTPGGARWCVKGSDLNVLDEFDAVILTAPSPQALEILSCGDGASWLDASLGGSLRQSLQALQWSSRYALSLFFDQSATAIFEQNANWVSLYPERDPIIVFLSHDNAKRNVGGAPTLLVHSSVPYGIKGMTQGIADEKIKEEMLEAVRRRLPWLPSPLATSLHTWRVSQVRRPLASLPGGRACIPLRASRGAEQRKLPPLILASDAFSQHGSRFDGCVQSGEDAAAVLLDALSKGNPA